MENKTLTWDQISVALDSNILQIFIDGRIAAEISNCNNHNLHDDFIIEILCGMGYTVN